MIQPLLNIMQDLNNMQVCNDFPVSMFMYDRRRARMNLEGPSIFATECLKIIEIYLTSGLHETYIRN